MSNIMTCKHEIVKCERKVSNIGSDLEYISDKINLPKIEEKGMVQYFYHSPDSKLPVRDIFERQKPEPHIEIGAENYLSKCYQPNIKEFVRRDMKCLFLITTCKNKEINKKINRKFGKNKTNQFIVGYIVKKEDFITGGHICIMGKTFIYSFDDSILVKNIFDKNFAQSENKGKTLSLCRDVFLDNKKTEKILKHFKKKTNILSKCIEEIKKLDARNQKEKTCLVLRGEKCRFQNNGCLRGSVK